MKKILGVVVVLAILVGVGWWYSPAARSALQQITMSGVSGGAWTLYQNPQRWYEVLMPPSVQPSSNANVSEIVSFSLDKYLKLPNSVLALLDQPERGSDLYMYIHVRTVDNTSNLPVREWVRKNLEEVVHGDIPNARYETTLAGEPTYYAEYVSSIATAGEKEIFMIISYKYYLFHNGYLYEISGIKVPVNPPQAFMNHPYYPYLKAAEPVAEKMIQSFKFTQ